MTSGPMFRDRFPIFEQKTYLASHSLGAVPRATETRLLEYYELWATRGIQAWDGPWSEIIAEFSRTVEGLLGAASGTIVPMENVTRGFAAVASALDWSGRRNKIVLTELEFLTSYPFWQGWAGLMKARLVVVPSDDGVTVPIERLLAAIDEETLIVPTSHVYFRSGTVQDLEAVAEKCRKTGAFSLGDGYQAAGIVPMHLARMGIDFYVGGSHKWLCGGPGAGFLYVRPELIQKLTPAFAGWFGIENSFDYKASTQFAPAPGVTKFLAGTPAIPALYAAIEGIRTVAEVGMERIRAHSIELTAQIITRADERGLAVRTPRDPALRSGMVCLDFEGAQAAADRLCERGVIVDYRPKCGIRVSPHFYNSREDIETFFRELDGMK